MDLVVEAVVSEEIEVVVEEVLVVFVEVTEVVGDLSVGVIVVEELLEEATEISMEVQGAEIPTKKDLPFAMKLPMLFNCGSLTKQMFQQRKTFCNNSLAYILDIKSLLTTKITFFCLKILNLLKMPKLN